MITLTLTLSQQALLRQMATAWRDHLTGVRAKAARLNQEIAMHNAQIDLNDTNQLLGLLGSEPMAEEVMPERRMKMLPNNSSAGRIIDAEIVEDPNG